MQKTGNETRNADFYDQGQNPSCVMMRGRRTITVTGYLLFMQL